MLRTMSEAVPYPRCPESCLIDRTEAGVAAGIRETAYAGFPIPCPTEGCGMRTAFGTGGRILGAAALQRTGCRRYQVWASQVAITGRSELVAVAGGESTRSAALPAGSAVATVSTEGIVTATITPSVDGAEAPPALEAASALPAPDELNV